MERIKVTGKKSKRILERYTDHNGENWIRLKYRDRFETEIIMSEYEFNRIHGIFD